MCIRNREMSRRARVLLVCGLMSLAVGAGLQAFVPVHPEADSARLEGLRGFLLGLGVVLNFDAVIERRRKCL